MTAAEGCKTPWLASYCPGCEVFLKLQRLGNLRLAFANTLAFFFGLILLNFGCFAAVKRARNARCGSWVSLAHSLGCYPSFGRPAGRERRKDFTGVQRRTGHVRRANATQIAIN